MLRTTLMATVAALTLTHSAYGILVVTATEAPLGTFSTAVTTDEVFDTIEIGVNGDVANGLNIVPIIEIYGKQYVSSDPSFTLLSPLGGILLSTEGVFEPGLNYHIDLTYGVTSPVPGQWTVGLDNAAFLQFDLISGIGDISVDLLLGGMLVDSAAIQVSSITAVPEAGAIIVWSLLASGVTLLKLRRHASDRDITTQLT